MTLAEVQARAANAMLKAELDALGDAYNALLADINDLKNDLALAVAERNNLRKWHDAYQHKLEDDNGTSYVRH